MAIVELEQAEAPNSHLMIVPKELLKMPPDATLTLIQVPSNWVYPVAQVLHMVPEQIKQLGYPVAVEQIVAIPEIMVYPGFAEVQTMAEVQVRQLAGQIEQEVALAR